VPAIRLAILINVVASAALVAAGLRYARRPELPRSAPRYRGLQGVRAIHRRSYRGVRYSRRMSSGRIRGLDVFTVSAATIEAAASAMPASVSVCRHGNCCRMSP